MFTLSTDAQRWLFPVLNTNITCVLLLLNMLSCSLIVCVSVCCPLLTDSSALSSTSVPHIIPILSLLERGMALGETLEPWESAEVGVDVVMHHLEAARTIAHHGGIYRTTAETKLQGKTRSNGAFSSINRWRQEAETFVLMFGFWAHFISCDVTVSMWRWVPVNNDRVLYHDITAWRNDSVLIPNKSLVVTSLRRLQLLLTACQ